MTAQRSEEVQRRQVRKRLTRGLLAGLAAIGLPAVANAVIRRRARDLPPSRWGRSHRYSWRRGKVVFQSLGEGPAVVLLHSLGLGHSGEEWRQVAERLGRSFQVLVPDLPGWGRSDRAPEPPSPGLYTEFLGDFLREVVRGRAALAAAGQPAAYALELAAAEPAQVRALGLAGPLGLAVHTGSGEVEDRLLYPLLRLPVLGTSALNVLTSRVSLARHLRQEVYAAPETVDAALVEHHYQASHRPAARAALVAFLAGELSRDVEEILPGLAAPVWLAWGRHSIHPPVEDADLWLSRLGGATLEVFEGSGALPHAEEPAAFALSFGSFLASLPE